MLHLHLMDRLSNGILHMVTLRHRAQFLPLKWEKGEKSTEKWCRLDTLTPVAGRILEAKIERYFLESFFRERNFGRNITCLQLVPSN